MIFVTIVNELITKTVKVKLQCDLHHKNFFIDLLKSLLQSKKESITIWIEL
jgi:hypothetical protein